MTSAMAGPGRFHQRVRRWVVAGTLAPVLVGLAGCGGDSKPTAEEAKAAKNRWIQRVDSACRKANDAIAERGWPANLVDLDRLVVRGIDDARAAIESVAAVKIPEGAGPRPGAFVKELKALDPELTKLSEASEGLEPAELIKIADALKTPLAEAEKRAEAAGLSDCLTHGERFFVPDGVRAPVFAEQFARLNRSVLKRLRSARLRAATTPGEVNTAFRRMSATLGSAVSGMDRLDPPQWAEKQTSTYQDALLELQSAIQEYENLLAKDRGKPAASRDYADYIRREKELRRAARAEGKAHRKLLRAVGAAPTFRIPPGDEGDAAEPDSGEVA
jgi:hypothetical protein